MQIQLDLEMAQRWPSRRVAAGYTVVVVGSQGAERCSLQRGPWAGHTYICQVRDGNVWAQTLVCDVNARRRARVRDEGLNPRSPEDEYI